MCFKPSTTSNYPEVMFLVEEVIEAIKEKFPDMKFDIDDRKFWTVSAEAWGEIIRDALMNMPKYISERYDCDNFARTCACRIAQKHFLNSMGVAEGYNAAGYRHKFNLFFTDKLDIFLLEPQNGTIYDMEDMGGYRVEELYLG